MKQTKFFKYLTLSASLLMLSLSLPAAATAEDTAKITETVMNYFEGIGQADYQRLKKAFNLKAQMITPEKSELKVWKIAPTIKNWGNGKPATKKRIGKILNMHIMDGRLASVSFDSDNQYYDLLVLAKMEGEWKIINKAYVNKYE